MDFEVKEKHTGVNWNGNEVSFNKVWGGHTFTDEECAALLKGETIALKDCVSKKGKPFGCYGRLEEQEYNGHKFWGFKRTEWLNEDRVPDIWCGHKFTSDEVEKLDSGYSIRLNDTIAQMTGRPFACVVRWGYQHEGDTQKHIIPEYD